MNDKVKRLPRIEINYQLLIVNVAVLYTFLVSTAYLYGLYNYFNINIFPYLTFTNVAIAILWAFLPYIIFQLLSYYFLIEITEPIIRRALDRLQRGLEKLSFDNAMHKLRLLRIVMKIIDLIFILFFLVAGYFLGMASFFALVIISLITKKIIFNYHPLERMIVVLILILPIIAYDYGHFSAKKIYKNINYQYMTSENNEKEALKYIGYAGGQYFFVTFNNDEVYILPNNSKIKLKYFDTSSIKEAFLKLQSR